MFNYQKERVVIIGLGITGLSCVNFFLHRNIVPRVMDTRFSPPGLKMLPPNVPYHLGTLNKPWLLDATLIIISPGIPLTHPALALVNVEIISDIELFAREITIPVVAITGSNGKSTVTRMVENMAICAGWRVGVGGNIGFPVLNLLNANLQLCVLELSSFQLETTYNLRTVVATILNVSEDHMDRYPLGFQQYHLTKLEIYRYANTCVVNAQDILTLPKCDKSNYCVSFGDAYGDYCLKQHNGHTWLMAYDELLLDCNEIFINGRFNYINTLAALAIADTVGIPRSASLTAIRQFRGLAHRFELVHESNGIRWINDSKATNIGSTKAALSSLEVIGTLHLLLGGDSKSADFSLLTPWLQGERIQLYCFGQDGAQLAMLRPNISILTDTLEQAMYIISCRVKTGDLVLLSPACSSLDQFTNFELRGETFMRLAQEVN